MIHFIAGRSGSGKTTLLMESLKRSLEIPGREAVLLVPEQQTVVTESRVVKEMRPSDNLRLEVTNFTRLADSVFRQTGGLDQPVIDEGSRCLYVWQAMRRVWDDLHAFGGAMVEREDRNIGRLMRAVDEFKWSGITPSDAETALEKMKLEENVPLDLMSRFSDAVKVYSAYQAILREKAVDRNDLSDLLADALERHAYFKGKSVFVDAFFSLTAPRERVLSAVFRQAEDVTMTFCVPKPSDAAPAGLQFLENQLYFERTQALCGKLGLETEITWLETDYRHQNNPELGAVEAVLFVPGWAGRKLSENPAKTESVHLIRCADRADEAEAAAAVIDRLLHEGDYRCREIAVVARNMKSREAILDPVLRRHGIPCFLSESSAVSTSPAVRLILAALAVRTGNWQRTDLIRLLKTGLTPADLPEHGDFLGESFESYTATWNIRGRKAYTEKDWTMNPAGYRAEWTEGGRQILAKANVTRRLIVPALEEFLSLFDRGNGSVPVRDIAEAVVAFAEKYRLAETLKRSADTFRSAGLPADADRTERSWDAVCGILDRMVDILGETTLDAELFAGLFARVAAFMDVSSIPTALDEVVLSSASDVRFDSARCVIVLGSTDGEFPGVAAEGTAFFSDRDRVALQSVDLELTAPDLSRTAARENFMYYRCVAAATEQCYILSPSEDGVWSEGARQVKAILASMDREAEVSFADLPLADAVYHRAGAEYLLARRTDPAERVALRALAGEKDEKDVALTGENDVIDGTEGNLSLSQTRIESYVTCPFNYTCKYLVKAQEEARAEIGAADVGTFIHAVLEQFFEEIPAGRFRTLGEEELQAVAERIIGRYVDELGGGKRDGRLDYLFQRLRRYVFLFLRVLTEELGQSQFIPAAMEMPIGKRKDGEAAVDPIRFTTPGGASVTLRGVADRIDLYEKGGKKYIRIVDYKTGKKKFSLAKVEKGLDLQLLIYLFSVEKNRLPGMAPSTAMVPAAAVYFAARPAAETADRILSVDEARDMTVGKIGRSGLVLGEPDILNAIDSGRSGRFFPNGKPEKEGIVCLSSAEEFGEIYTKLETAVRAIAGRMEKGEAGAKPMKTESRMPCTDCPNRLICRAGRPDRTETSR